MSFWMERDMSEIKTNEVATTIVQLTRNLHHLKHTLPKVVPLTTKTKYMANLKESISDL